MTHPLPETVRERLTLRAVGTWVVAVGVLWLLTDRAPIQFAASVAAMAAFGAVEVLSDAYDLRASVARVGVGAYATISGTAMLAVGGTTAWLPLVLLAFGGWFVLDAVQSIRYEGATVEDEPLDGRQVYHDYVGRQIHETLDERPRTRRELGDLLDAEADAIDAALGKLLARGVVVRAGSELRVRPPDDRSFPERARDRVVGIARRVARPATIGFAEHGADESSSGEGDADPHGASRNGRDAIERSATSEQSATDEHEREREPTG